MDTMHNTPIAANNFRRCDIRSLFDSGPENSISASDVGAKIFISVPFGEYSVSTTSINASSRRFRIWYRIDWMDVPSSTAKAEIERGSLASCMDGSRDHSSEKAETFLQSEMIDQLDSFTVFFGSGALTDLSHEHWRDEIVPQQLPFLRDNFLAHEKAAMYEGRPIFSIWNARTFALGEEREKIIEEFGSLESTTE